jgi:hypothetical protein
MIPIFSFSSAQGRPPWVPDFTGMTAKEWVPNVKIIPLVVRILHLVPRKPAETGGKAGLFTVPSVAFAPLGCRLCIFAAVAVKYIGIFWNITNREPHAYSMV